MRHVTNAGTFKFKIDMDSGRVNIPKKNQMYAQLLF
jgi:hypothetical protein